MVTLRALLSDYYDRFPAADPRLAPARWSSRDGEGVTVALLDGCPARAVEDLEGAAIERLDFADAGGPACEHATHGACLLIGQGVAAVRGLVPRARLLACAVVDRAGEVSPAALAAALAEACRRGAGIVALPLGAHDDEPEVAQAVSAALAAGVTIVAAAGNAHPRPILFPARLPGVFAVAAADERGRLLEDSCRGPELGACAPGLRVTAMVGPGRAAPRSGTSVATALVAGALALAARPQLP